MERRRPVCTSLEWSTKYTAFDLAKLHIQPGLLIKTTGFIINVCEIRSTEDIFSYWIKIPIEFRNIVILFNNNLHDNIS